MKKNRFISFVTSVAIAASALSGLMLHASAESTTYTWDFTQMTAEIAIGSDIISDGGESTVIMSNPGAKFSVATGKVTNANGESITVAKTEAQVGNAVRLAIPEGDSAVLTMDLSTGSSKKAIILRAEDGTAVFTANDYTKNVMKEYTVSVAPGAVYTIDTTAYKAYIGKVTLTVAQGGGSDTPIDKETETPTEETTEQATEEVTEKATEETTEQATEEATENATEAAATKEPGGVKGEMSWAATADAAQGEILMQGMSPLISLKYSADKDGKTYPDGSVFSGYITHSETNGSIKNGEVSGNAIKFVAPDNGMWYVYLNNVGANKTAYIMHEGEVSDGTALDKITTTATSNVLLEAYVKAGETYYATVSGSKGRYAAAKFVPGAQPSETPSTSPSISPSTEPSATPIPSQNTPIPVEGGVALWYANESVTAGQGLMIGLSSMGSLNYTAGAKNFSDGTKTSGYITGSDGFGPGKTPSAGSLKFTAPVDGELFAYITGVKNKTAYIIDESDMSAVATAAETEGTSTDFILETEVVAGKTYYITVAGSKGRFAAAKFVSATGSIPTPTPEPSPTPVTEESLKEALEFAKAEAASLMLNSLSQTAAYFDIDLTKTTASGLPVTWESSNPDYLAVRTVSHIKRNYTGVVSRPKEGDPNIVDGGVPVTLTATVDNNGQKASKIFEISVRQWNPNVYYNDFQQDVGLGAEGTFKAISDNVKPATPDKREDETSGGQTWRRAPFRGIRLDTLKESRAFTSFKHNNVDTSAVFDKRLMSTKGTAYGAPEGTNEEENFVFYYSEHTPAGGSSTIPMWIELTDPATGSAPEGIVMMSMDIYVVDGSNKISLGLANSSPAQMCRFMIGDSTNQDFNGYKGTGYLRCFNNEASVDFMGGTGGYRVPEGEWINATMVANTDSHKWDMYFDGMQVASGLAFRNAKDCVSNIEFVLDRNYPRADKGDNIAAYLFDNIYVENLTTDYAKTYWDAVEISSLPYDAQTDTYTATSGKRFLLQYQGTGSLSGNRFKWTSLNKDALSIETVGIKAEKLEEFGYTKEQIAAEKAAGNHEPTVVIATPNVTKQETVTLRAMMKSGEDELEKEFKVVINPDGTVTEPTPTPTVKPSTGGSGGGGGGGGTTTKKPTLSGVSIADGVSKPITSGIAAAPEATSRPTGTEVFTDLFKTEWAREAVMYLYEKDIVNGYGDGTYGVNDSVTREQFVKILLTAFNLPIYKHETTSFTDIEEGSWYEHYVETAVRMGLVNGVSDNSFGIGQPISRQDIAVMCMRVQDLLDSDIEIPTEEELTDDFAPQLIDNEAPDTTEAPEDAEATEAPEAVKAAEKQKEIDDAITALSFGDKASIADYALAAVARMAAKGYINGDDNGNFNGANSSTRAETAAMIYRIIK